MNEMAGLGALQGQKSPVPEGLRALMDAQEILKQQASPMTPQGTPTVAAQAEQAIQAQLQAAAPQQSAPGMMPNDPFREQLMKTLQMQAQAQMQGQPQPAPEQSGIAQLPAPNMQGMKEGGIVGFDAGGDIESVVYGPYSGRNLDVLNPKEDKQYDPTQMLLDELRRVSGEIQSVSSQKGPTAFTKEEAYKEFEQLGLPKLWEAKRAAATDLSGKYENIARQRAALHEKEKGMRDSEVWGALFKGQDVGQVKRSMLERDKAYNESLMRDLDFAAKMADLGNSANESEWKYNLDKTLAKVDDYNKAADVFKADRQTLLTALRGQHGSLLQAYARQYAADARGEGKPTNMKEYADNYLAKMRESGDTRPEGVIRTEANQDFLQRQQQAALARAGTAAKALDFKQIDEARDATLKRIDDAKNNRNNALFGELRAARKDPAKYNQIVSRLYREELLSRKINPTDIDTFANDVFDIGAKASKPAPASAPGSTNAPKSNVTVKNW